MSLKRMDVDALGLDELDRSLLRAIIEMYNGGPVGLETLAAALGEEAVTLEDLCEPYLMQMGFLTRTPRGRCATRLAYEHLGLKAPETGSPETTDNRACFNRLALSGASRQLILPLSHCDISLRPEGVFRRGAKNRTERECALKCGGIYYGKIFWNRWRARCGGRRPDL